MELKVSSAIEEKPKKDAYKSLPPDIVEHLERHFGNWLNHFEVSMKWRKDYGGYGIFIKIPKEYSTEYKEEWREVYDNATRGPKLGENGLPVRKLVIYEDIRCKPLKEPSEVKNWLLMVKENIITTAYRKGIKLPSTNTAMDESKQTLDEYAKAIHR